MRRTATALVFTLGLSVSTALGGCSYLDFAPQTRGNRVDTDQMKELVPGTSTKADVTSLLGSPTAHASFDDNTWIYISEVTQPRIGRIQGVNSQDVVSLTFDDGGVLQSMKHLDKGNSMPVAVVARSTPSPGSESSFLQQLLGNVGKFTAGGPTNSSAGGSGAAFGTPQ